MVVKNTETFISYPLPNISMANGIERMHKDIIDIKKDVEFIKHILSEDFELNQRTKKALKKSRATPKSKYVNVDELD